MSSKWSEFDDVAVRETEKKFLLTGSIRTSNDNCWQKVSLIVTKSVLDARGTLTLLREEYERRQIF